MFPKWPKEGEKEGKMGLPFPSPLVSLVLEAKQARAGSSGVWRGVQRLWGQDTSRPQFSEDAPETARATASGGRRGGRGWKTSGRL